MLLSYRNKKEKGLEKKKDKQNDIIDYIKKKGECSLE